MSRPRSSLELIRQWIYAPRAIHEYLFLAMICILILFVVLMARVDPVEAVIACLMAFIGVLFRSPVTALSFLAVLGVMTTRPISDYHPVGNVSDIVQGSFRISDFAICFLALVIVAANLRIMSMFEPSLAIDTPLPGDRASRARVAAEEAKAIRPGAIVPEDEIRRLLLAAAGAIVGGQVVWALCTHIHVDFRQDVPFTWSRNFSDASGIAAAPWLDRILVLFSLAALVIVPYITLHHIRKWSEMSPEEARMVLLDTGWRETRREWNRTEVWRAWVLNRLRFRPKPKPALPPKTFRRVTAWNRLFTKVSLAGCAVVVVFLVAFGIAIIVVWYGEDTLTSWFPRFRF